MFFAKSGDPRTCGRKGADGLRRRGEKGLFLRLHAAQPQVSQKGAHRSRVQVPKQAQGPCPTCRPTRSFPKTSCKATVVPCCHSRHCRRLSRDSVPPQDCAASRVPCHCSCKHTDPHSPLHSELGCPTLTKLGCAPGWAGKSKIDRCVSGKAGDYEYPLRSPAPETSPGVRFGRDQ